MPKVITIIQPWAQLVVMGLKIYETRSWSTNHRGSLFIHASKKPMCKAGKHLAEKYNLQNLIYGAIIGHVDIVDCIEITRDMPLSGDERELGDFTPGRFAWQNAYPYMLKEPIYCKGALGLWNYPL